MINELFSSMHELLDYIIEHYSNADDELKAEFCYRVQQLKETNDLLMDHYVSVEEKLVLFFELYRCLQEEAVQQAAEAEAASTNVTAADSLPKRQSSAQHDTPKQPQPLYPAGITAIYHESEAASCNECDLFISPEHELALDQAQGYYKLFMFAEAARILQTIIAEQPECNIARIYYGMSLMHLRNWSEAQRQFQLLTVLSDFPKWLALSYNALGCIQAIKLNLNQAELLFKKAYQLYPQFEDPLKNLQSCVESPQHLSLYFGSTELCCM